MANQNAVNGLIPTTTDYGGEYLSKLRRICFLASDGTATFIGDLIKLTGDSSADGQAEAVAQAAAGDAAVGVLVALDELLPSTLGEGALSTANYRRASTLRYGYAAFGPDVIYSCQEDSVGGSIATTSSGQNINVIVGSGNTVTGLSGMQLDSSTAATSNTLQLRLRGIDTTIGNATGTNCRWLVSLNLAQDTITTGV